MTARERFAPRTDFGHSAYSYQAAMALCQLSDAEVSRMCKVSLATVAAWRSGDAAIPFSVYALLRLHATGELPETFPYFAGWVMDFRHGLIFPPGERHGLAEADVSCVRELRYAASYAEREARQARAAANDAQADARRTVLAQRGAALGEVQRLRLEVAELRKQRDFYRRQCTLEARHGLYLLKLLGLIAG